MRLDNNMDSQSKNNVLSYSDLVQVLINLIILLGLEAGCLGLETNDCSVPVTISNFFFILSTI